MPLVRNKGILLDATNCYFFTIQFTAMYQRNNQTDLASVLTDVAGGIRDFIGPVGQYLGHVGEYEILNPFQEGARAESTKSNDPIPGGFWERLGIHRIVSNTLHDRLEIHDRGYIESDKPPFRWNSLKNSAAIEGLRTLISGCPIVQFADWAKTDGASVFWDGLFSDVIKPINKRNFDFIFQLGDITKRPGFEVDEILDIMGDYSSYGRVTLILDEDEAGKLWSWLNGCDQHAATPGARPHTAKEKFLFLFNAMHVDVLLILCSNHAVLLSEDCQSDFAGSSLNINMPGYARDCFNTGYQLGLLLHFDIPHCIVFGLAVSGAYAENASGADSTTLLEYINAWMAALRPGRLKDRACCIN